MKSGDMRKQPNRIWNEDINKNKKKFVKLNKNNATKAVKK